MDNNTDILLIDKPVGMTSFDVIRALRKKTGIRKYGHAGTLDPLASGLMILGVEKGTKRLSEFLKLDKEYVAEIRIGESRTTDDLEGEIVEENEVQPIEAQTIVQALHQITGHLTLPVSAYSAIKKDGIAMYKRARKAEKEGVVIEDVPARAMEVYSAVLLDTQHVTIDHKKRLIATVRFHVGSGTYIRSLGKELGKILGYPATLQALRRTKIGTFSVEDALEL